jgi:hypothetical protein
MNKSFNNIIMQTINYCPIIVLSTLLDHQA